MEVHPLCELAASGNSTELHAGLESGEYDEVPTNVWKRATIGALKTHNWSNASSVALRVIGNSHGKKGSDFIKDVINAALKLGETTFVDEVRCGRCFETQDLHWFLISAVRSNTPEAVKLVFDGGWGYDVENRSIEAAATLARKKGCIQEILDVLAQELEERRD